MVLEVLTSYTLEWFDIPTTESLQGSRSNYSCLEEGRCFEYGIIQ